MIKINKNLKPDGETKKYYRYKLQDEDGLFTIYLNKSVHEKPKGDLLVQVSE